MMRSKTVLLLILTLLPVLSTQAQDKQERVYLENTDTTRSAVKVSWLQSRGRDNWFITLNGGVADLMSEEARYVKFSDRIKPTLGFSVGKWLTPVWGLRMNITGAKLQGFATWNYTTDTGLGDWYVGKNYPNHYGVNSTNNYMHAYDKDPDVREFIRETYLGDKRTSKKGDGYDYEVQYAAASIDFLLNMKYLFRPYDSKGVFNPILYGGLGFAHTFEEKDRTAVNSIMEKFGLMFDFRLNDAWSINLDGQFLILPELFDRRVGDGNTQDVVGNYTVGITYKFKDRNFYKANLADPAQIAALNDEINELRKRPVACPPIPVVICPECPKAPEVAKTTQIDTLKTPITKQNLTFLPTPVFFRINSSAIDDAQWNSIEKAVEYLKENPGKRIKVTGYADKKTGTVATNKRLSEQRAKSVYDTLVKKYGISPERIETSSLGDNFQPFAENDWNRVVIFVIP